MSTLTSLTITPANPFKLVSETQLFTLTAHYSDAPDDPTVGTDPTTNWSSSDTAVATIANSGPSKGTATAQTISGSTTITATYGDFSATTVLRVGLANYSRIVEPTVEGQRVGETLLNAAYNPIPQLTVPAVSMFTGAVVFSNANATSGGPIGYTTVSGHPGNFCELYIAEEQQQIGDWVQQNPSANATISFNASQKNLGIVSSISIDASGSQLGSGGNPVFVQIAGEGYANAAGSINIGDFLGPDDSNPGCVKSIVFDPESPTPVLGFALENVGTTFADKVKMRIQICGE